METTHKEWILKELQEIKNDPKNKNKGLIPRFHQTVADRFYGGTKLSLSKVCQEMVDLGDLFKSFIKFSPSSNDVIEDNIVVSGNHKGMKVGKDGKLSTPIFWKAGDSDIPEWTKRNEERMVAYRQGKTEFEQITSENLM
jgi:hypothetical protein